MPEVRRCADSDRAAVLAIINEAAQAYRGAIPGDRWRDPYMPDEELAAEMRAGVRFWGLERAGALVGVMGMQRVVDVTLIRHAYVRPCAQRSGVGGILLRHLMAMAEKPVLVGTWAAASWAIGFYQRHGFHLLDASTAHPLMRKYWRIPERQVESSVVLSSPSDLPARDGAQ